MIPLAVMMPAKKLLLSFALLLALVVGCRGAGGPAPQSLAPVAKATGTAEPTQSPTRPPSPAPSATPRPATATSTLAPTPTPSPTITPTPEPTPLHFAVIGDYGRAGEAEAAVAELVKDWSPDLIITTGDNNYPDGKAATIDDNVGQYYAGFIHPYQGAYGPGSAENRFFPVPGNHDWHAADLAPYLDYFELPGNERYYDFIRGPVHFFALDSDSHEPDGVNQGSIQAQWLRQRLAASTSTWNIVYLHHAPYSSAHHGDTDWMQWPFAEWGASAVLSGHEHVYEHLVVDGLDYFNNGLGGQPARYAFHEPRPGSQTRYNDAHGALLVVADEDRLVFEFVNVDGEVIDRVVLEGN